MEIAPVRQRPGRLDPDQQFDKSAGLRYLAVSLSEEKDNALDGGTVIRSNDPRHRGGLSLVDAIMAGQSRAVAVPPLSAHRVESGVAPMEFPDGPGAIFVTSHAGISLSAGGLWFVSCGFIALPFHHAASWQPCPPGDATLKVNQPASEEACLTKVSVSLQWSDGF